MKKTQVNKEKKTLPTKSNTTSKLKQNKEITLEMLEEAQHTMSKKEFMKFLSTVDMKKLEQMLAPKLIVHEKSSCTKSNTFYMDLLQIPHEETQTQKSYDVWRFEPYPYKPITAEDLF